MSSVRDDDAVRAIADAIRQYVSENPAAADPPAWIRRWWLPSTLAEESEDNLVEALESLVCAGVLERRTLGDGGVVYAGVRTAP